MTLPSEPRVFEIGLLDLCALGDDAIRRGEWGLLGLAAEELASRASPRLRRFAQEIRLLVVDGDTQTAQGLWEHLRDAASHPAAVTSSAVLTGA